MNKVLVGLAASAALFALAGCKRSGGAIAKVEEFSNKMCECPDKACADRVNREYARWGQAVATTSKSTAVISGDDTVKMTEAAMKYSECFTRLAMAAAGPPRSR